MEGMVSDFERGMEKELPSVEGNSVIVSRCYDLMISWLTVNLMDQQGE